MHTSTILCSRSRCGAREAMTVGCKPTRRYHARMARFYVREANERTSERADNRLDKQDVAWPAARSAALLPKAKRPREQCIAECCCLTLLGPAAAKRQPSEGHNVRQECCQTSKTRMCARLKIRTTDRTPLVKLA